MDRPALPAPVIVAVAMLGGLVLLGIGVTLAQAAAAPTALPLPVVLVAAGMRSIIPLLFIVFLLLGHPLAHQWATLVSFLALVVGVFGAAGAEGNVERLLAAGYVAFPLSVIVLLGRPSSLRYFDLQCPSCGAFKTKAKSFLYNAKGCGACGFRWRHREHPAGGPAA